MNEKKELKVDSFVPVGSYYALEQITHGFEEYIKGYCLLEYNGQLYLGQTVEEVIQTDEGCGYDLSGMGKHSGVGDILDELGLPFIDNGSKTHINYTYIDGIKIINPDGTLSDKVNNELLQKVRNLFSIEIETDDEHYISEEDIDNPGDFLINPDLLKKFGHIEHENSMVCISTGNMPFGNISAKLVEKENQVVLQLDEMEFVIYDTETGIKSEKVERIKATTNLGDLLRRNKI